MCASRVERGEARGAEEGRASAMRPLDRRLVWRCAQLGAEGGFEERVALPRRSRVAQELERSEPHAGGSFLHEALSPSHDGRGGAQRRGRRVDDVGASRGCVDPREKPEARDRGRAAALSAGGVAVRSQRALQRTGRRADRQPLERSRALSNLGAQLLDLDQRLRARGGGGHPWVRAGALC